MLYFVNFSVVQKSVPADFRSTSDTNCAVCRALTFCVVNSCPKNVELLLRFFFNIVAVICTTITTWNSCLGLDVLVGCIDVST